MTAAFMGDCHYCKTTGHRAADCAKKKADIARGIWHPAGSEPRTYMEAP